MSTWIAEMEAIMAKEGAELFREFIRHFSEVEVVDYYTNGTWNTEQMRIDLQLVMQHRREAGAPDPPPLEDIKLPELPQQSATKPGGALGLSSGGVSLVEELKEMALFIAKIKSDPLKSKAILSKVAPNRRKWVIQNYTPPAGESDATQALEKYIENCAKENKWPAAVVAKPAVLAKPAAVLQTSVTAAGKVALPSAATAGGARPAIMIGGAKPALAAAIASLGAVKRPIVSIGGAAVSEASKRPAISISGSARPALVTSTPRPAMLISRPAAAAPTPVVAAAPAATATIGARPVIRLMGQR